MALKFITLLKNTRSLILLGIVGLVLIACSVEGGSPGPADNSAGAPASTVLPPPPAQAHRDTTVYIIHHAIGEAETVTDMAGIQAVLPFQVVMPQLLFHDMYLKRVAVSLPPTHLSESGQRRNTRVSLTYGNEARTAGFMVHQSIMEEGMGPLVLDGPGDKRVITIAGNRGQVIKDEERQSLSLAWVTCGVQLAVGASTAGELSEPELIRIANSTSAC